MFWTTIFSLSLITATGRRDFYQILGLHHDCTEREIDRVFQQLSRKWHPDKNKGNAEAAAKFTDINDAYASLKDPLKRRVYDLYGEAGVHVFESPKSELSSPFTMVRSDDPNDAAAKIRTKGKTYRMQFPVDLIDFTNSAHYQLFVTRRVMCRCPHMGWLCPKCRNRPTIRDNVTLSLVIEKGSDDGTVHVFKNAGDTSEANSPGDIEIEVLAKPHPFLVRKGSELHVNISITLREALLGFTRTVKNVDGSDVEIETHGPIDSSQTVRMPGKGMPLYLYPGEFGDMVVHANVRWPNQLAQDKRHKIADILQTASY
jgi:DnaJ family protein B protein 11